MEDAAVKGRVNAGGKLNPSLPLSPEDDPVSSWMILLTSVMVGGGQTRIFISYAHADGTRMASRLQADLQMQGLTVWVDKSGIPGGSVWAKRIEEAVRNSDVVVVVLTPGYDSSLTCHNEQDLALELGKRIIPVLAARNCPIPLRLRGIQYLDFQEESAYQDSLRRLLGDLAGRPMSSALTPGHADRPDPPEYWKQREAVPRTEILKRILGAPRWCIWIRPVEFKTARFRSIDRCQEFIDASRVSLPQWFPYPSLPDSTETDNEWTLGEREKADGQLRFAERWTLYKSGQFVYHRTFDQLAEPGEPSKPSDSVHVVEILRTVTAAFEFAARMVRQRVIPSEAALRFELFKTDGLALTWPDGPPGYGDKVAPNCWCKDPTITVNRSLMPDKLAALPRELALEVALEIYGRFDWEGPPKQRLIELQGSVGPS